MLKKTCAILLFVGGVVLIGMGAFNEVKADEYVDPCNNFTIELESVVRDHGDVFNYNYIVTSGDLDISKISLLYLGIDGRLKVYADEGDVTDVSAPGEGVIVDGWLEGVPQIQVITVAPQSGIEAKPMTIHVSGSNGNVDTVALHTKSGNKVETCFVQGPVTGLPVDVSVPPQKIVVLMGAEGPVEFCLDVDPRTGCPYPDSVPYVCGTDPTDLNNQLPIDEGFVLGSGEEGDPEVPTAPTMVYGEGSDPRCPVSKVAHNPCQWVCVGGTCYGAYCW